MNREQDQSAPDIAARYWSERGGKPPPRPRHPLTVEQEHRYLLAGSDLWNRREFYDGHDEWEEVWRRAVGRRRHLLHGIIQVAVGYEHCKRGNMRGMRSLLRQGAAKLGEHVERDGVPALMSRALDDAARASTALSSRQTLTLDDVDPPKVTLLLEGERDAGHPTGITIGIPRGES